MSGFEIAGVVLGSIPLVIAALEHYAEGIATAKRYWKYKSGLRSLTLQINTERGIFMNTLEQLLTGIVRIEHMSEFLANPGSGLWQNKEIDEKLKERLRNSFEIYIDNVKGMEVALQKMMVKLALDDNGKPQFSDPGLFKQEYKRLKFSLTKAEYDEQLGNLKNFNQALTRLTKQSLELEPSRASTKSRSYPNFKVLQNYARSLYDTLRAGLQCSCQGHGVKLRLESRNKRLEKVEDVLEHTPFRVIFSYAFDTGALTSPPTDWKEVDIRWIMEKEKLIPLSPVALSPTVLPHHSKSCSSPGVKPKVRFNDIGVHIKKQHSTTVTILKDTSLSPTSHTKTTISAKPTLEQIQNLCKTITKLKQGEQDLCVGYLLDSLKRKHGLYPTSLPTTGQTPWIAYTLSDVITKRAKIGRRLMQQDKLRVALDLASSVLQLHKTPWLDDHWGKDDVFFIQRPGATLASTYEHLFVYRKFSSGVDNQGTSSQRMAGRVIRNQLLFRLGILLIELWYGKSIEELQEQADLSWEGTPGIVWCTAERLVEEEIEFEAGTRYSNAVRRCIRCDFDMKEMSLDNENFQKAVYDGVVAELERTLHEFSGKLD